MVLVELVVLCLVLELQEFGAEGAGWDGMTPWYSDSSKFLKQLQALYCAVLKNVGLEKNDLVWFATKLEIS